jgi:lysophospholipase L1-like esterase
MGALAAHENADGPKTASPAAPRPRRSPDGPRVLIIGDSQARGLGCRGKPFATLVADQLSASAVLNLARSGTTLAGMLATKTDAIRKFAPDIAVISSGGTEGLVVPGAGIQDAIERHAPEQWHGVANFQIPTDYDAPVAKEKAKKRLTAAGKLVVKHALIIASNGKSRHPLAEFADAVSELMNLLHELDCHALTLGLPLVDKSLWPRSNASLAQFTAVLAVGGRSTPGSGYLPTIPILRLWDDYLPDRCHLSTEGHQRLADAICADIEQRGWLQERTQPAGLVVQA